MNESKKLLKKCFLHFITVVFMAIAVFGRFDYVPNAVAADYYRSELTYYNNHYYQVIDKSMTWKKAKEYCEKRGGHLVTITSRKEQDFVNNMLHKTKTAYWLGLTDEVQENNWKWITGEKYLFTNWGSYEPSVYNRENGKPEDYSALNYNEGLNGVWYDELNQGGDKNGYKLYDHGIICEWDSLSRLKKYQDPDLSKYVKKVSSVKVKALVNKKINVSWKKQSTAGKYEIQIATDKKFKKGLLIKNAANNKGSVKIAYKKTGNVYIRVRALDKYGYVGKWSDVKNVKLP